MATAKGLLPRAGVTPPQGGKPILSSVLVLAKPMAFMLQGLHGVTGHGPQGGGVAYPHQGATVLPGFLQAQGHGPRAHHGTQTVIAIQHGTVRLLPHGGELWRWD